jgi:exonuclease III
MMANKVSSLNLCLGIPNKSNIVKKMSTQENVDGLCMQETNVDINLDHELLSFLGYNYENETNTIKARVGAYISSKLNNVRCQDLEGVGNHLIILDIKSNKDVRIIGLYRCFVSQDGATPREMFKRKLYVIKNAMTDKSVILGDFNLDKSQKRITSSAM